MGTIYKITNTLNGKAYIGQTHSPKKRIQEHFRGYGSTLLKQAIQKYGRDVFTVDILYDGVLPIFLDELEKDCIKRFDTVAPNGYNLETGGNRNKTLSAETRAKISAAHKGRKLKPLSPEHRAKIAESNRRRTISPETRKKLSEAAKGKKASPEARAKMSKAHKGNKYGKGKPSPMRGKKHSPEARAKMSASRKGNKNCVGRKLSPETRAKIAASQKRRNLRKRDAKSPLLPTESIHD